MDLGKPEKRLRIEPANEPAPLTPPDEQLPAPATDGRDA
jgi:hypothetical protein